MNIHEYQGKELLSKKGILTQKGYLVNEAKNSKEIALKLKEETNTNIWVIKAQILAGGRGKGGGVKLAKSIEEVYDISKSIIGMNLVTPQTPKEGKKVHKVLIAEDVYYEGESDIKEFYISVLLDRENQCNTIVYSTEGGMEIEEVAENNPDKIFKEHVNPLIGLQGFQARKIGFNLGLEGKAFNYMVDFLLKLYSTYVCSDATLIEINPLIKTSDDKILVVDTKMTLDDNSLFRHKDLEELRDYTEIEKSEIQAEEAGLNFVKLDGNVGCMVNGAGLAMATMDIIKQAGGNPANFLDVGGTADAKRVEKGIKIILSDRNVKIILINIFGGIVRCDRVASGLIDACKNMKEEIKGFDIVVRLEGTNSKIAKDMIDKSDINVIAVTEFQQAAVKITNIIKEKKIS